MTDAGNTTGAAAQAAAAAAAPGAPAGAPTPADAAAQAATTAASTAAAATAATAAATQGGAVDTSAWTPEARDAYTALQAKASGYQREAGDARMNSKRNAATEERASLLAQFTKLLDPNASEAMVPTLEGVTAQLGTMSDHADDAAKSLALVRAAWEHGIDPGKLGFLEYQLSLDPGYKALKVNAADFGDKLAATLAAQVARDSTFKLPVGAQASGVENLGGAQGATAITPEAFAAMSIMERTALYTSDNAAYRRLTA